MIIVWDLSANLWKSEIKNTTSPQRMINMLDISLQVNNHMCVIIMTPLGAMKPFWHVIPFWTKEKVIDWELDKK